MNQITIQIKDRKKAKALLTFLKSLDFIDKVVSDEEQKSQSTSIERDDAFFALSGIWSQRDITQESLRQKAWPNPS